MVGDPTAEVGTNIIELEDIVVENVIRDGMCVAKAWARAESTVSMPYKPRDPVIRYADTYKDVRERPRDRQPD
jgi:hypothetical protein